MANQDQVNEEQNTLADRLASPRPAPDDFMAGMYEVRESDKAAFGDKWIGPERFKPWEETLVARYEAPDDSDGQTVEAYCQAAPARFYTIKALDGVKSVKSPLASFEIGTGSGQEELAAHMAEAISGGMLALRAVNRDAAFDALVKAADFALKYHRMKTTQGREGFPSQLSSALSKALKLAGK